MGFRDKRDILPVPASFGNPNFRDEWLTPGPKRAYLEDNYFFELIISGGGNIKVEISGAYQVKPVKWHDGVGWVTKPVKWHNGTSWVATTN